MKRRLFRAGSALAAGMLLALVGCDLPIAMGEQSSLIVLATDSLWEQVEQQTYDILEPVIFTTREEKQYEVTQIGPTAPAYRDLRIMRNVLVFGTEFDPVMIEVAEKAGIPLLDMQPGRVFQAKDVWARGQMVTATLLRRGREATSWVDALPSVLNAVDESYRAFVLRRMFATSPDTALAADLARRFGFSLVVPRVYDRVAREKESGDSLVIVRNDNPDPSQLIRSVLIDWRPSVDSLTRDLALQWRAELDGVQYNVAQRIDDSHSTVTEFRIDGHPALEVTGIWADEVGNFPAGGPFSVWLVDCPNRTYFIDAWLYAPNEQKYEYVLQLQQILGSFRCAESG